MSQTMANSAPPPRQIPCTAAIVTFFDAMSARITAWNLVNISPTLSGVCAATSTPAENALPSPLITITETSARASISPKHCASSSIIGILTTFNGGCRREIRATGGSASNTSEANGITVSGLMVFSPCLCVSVVSSPLQIDRRLPHFPDGRERVARARLLRDPLFLIADDVEQELLVFC